MKLPSHVVKIPRKTAGGVHYDWRFIVKHNRPPEWPKTIRLPIDPAERTRDAAEVAAVARDGKRLNKQLDAMRKGRIEEAEGERGTLPWLMAQWRKSQDWKRIKPKTQQFYEDGWKHVRKWSSHQRSPHPQISTIKWPTIYNLVTVYSDRPGVQRQVINVLQRLFQIAFDKGVISENPWSDQKNRRWQSRKETQKKQTVTWREVEQIARICDEEGFPSMGTAVMIGFDLMQYPEDIIGMRFGEHYSAKDGVFMFDRAKTGVPAETPASAALIERIGQADRMFLVVYEKSGRPYTRRHFNRIFRECMKDTPFAEFQFRWLRHSGVKESDDAGVDERAIDAMGAWKPGAGRNVRNSNYRLHNADLAREGMSKRESFRNA